MESRQTVQTTKLAEREMFSRLRFHITAVLQLIFLFTAQQRVSAEEELSDPKTAQEIFYRPDEVQTIFLQITPDNLLRMQRALPRRIEVPATFRWRNLTLKNVAVRYKGNSSSHPWQTHKRSFLVRFDEYDDDQRFLGLQRVSFDNGVQFGSLFSEPIVTEILRDLGHPVHRCNYAKLYLNGKYHGIYVNVERIDKTFLKNHLPDSKGALYKVDEGGPGGNLQYLGDKPAVYRQTFEAKTKAAEKETGKLVELLRMINQSSPQEFAARWDSQFERDDFLETMAVMLYAGAFDQLTGWNPHNYYLYHDGISNRWRYLPWDLDVGFSATAFGRIPVLEGWHAAWPVPGHRPNPLLERIVNNPVLLQAYCKEAESILELYFHPDQLCAKIDAKYALIKEDLKTDPFPHRRVTNPEDRNYDAIVESMKQFVRKRYSSAKTQLENPGERPKRTPPPRGPEPQPGPKSISDPTELRVVSVSASQVQLQWKDNATNEAGHILQRANRNDAREFRNRIGKPGRNSTSATDRNLVPGRTYFYRVYAVHSTPQGPRGSSVSNVVSVTIPQPE